MIRVKTFVNKKPNYIHLKSEWLDLAINDFLSENDVEVIDIKYNSSLAVDGSGNIYYDHSALLIYRGK